MIHEKISAYFGEVAGDPHHRYRSWEHCYRFFRELTPSGIAAQRQNAALHLGFYLASWGMYRGSTFLLKRAYTVHLGVVDCLASPRLAPLWETQQIANDLFQGLTRVIERLVTLNSRPNPTIEPTRFWLHWPICTIAEHGIDFEIIDQDWQPMKLSELVATAVTILEPNLARGVIHGDIHGRNILLLDRIPAFIDFALSGPGHPLEDLVRLDSIVRSAAMRMLVDERTMREIIQAIYINGTTAEAILAEHAVLAASPLVGLAVRTAAKVREAALKVATAHSLGLPDLLAMTCVVAGHVLVAHHPGSGIERVLLSVVGSSLLASQA